jgi:hypothetical protein
LIALVVLLFGLGGWLLTARQAQKRTEAAFGRLMDRLAGPGAWRHEKLAVDFWSRTLTVEGLSADLTRWRPDLTAPLTVEKLEIVSLADGEVWDAAPAGETPLLKRAALTRLAVKPAAPGEVQLDLASLALEGLSLAGPGSKAPAVPDAAETAASIWLDHLRLKRLTVDQAVLYASGWRLAMGGAELTELQRAAGDQGGLAFLSRLAAREAVFRELDLEWAGSGQARSGRVKFAEKRLTDWRGLKVGRLAWRQAEAELSGGPEQGALGNSLKGSLGHLALDGLDLAPLVARLQAAAAGLEPTPKNLAELLSLAGRRPPTAADLLAPPVSFDAVSLAEAQIELGDLIKLAFEKAELVGPFEAGALPPLQTRRVEGLKLELQNPPSCATCSSSAAGLASRVIFVVSGEQKTSFDSASGALSFEGRLDDVEQFALRGGFVLAGVTPELLAALGRTPFREFASVFDLPEASGLAVSSLSLELQNRALGENLLNFGASIGLGVKEELKAAAEMKLKSHLQREYEGVLEDLPLVTARLLDFLAEPRSLALTAAPPRPINWQARRDDFAQLFNDLSLGLSINGQTPAPLKLTGLATPSWGLGGWAGGAEEQQEAVPAEDGPAAGSEAGEGGQAAAPEAGEDAPGFQGGEGGQAAEPPVAGRLFTAPDDAKLVAQAAPTFGLLLDKLFGAGRWRTKAIGVDVKARLIFAEGLTVQAKDPARQAPLTVERIELKGLPGQAELAELLALEAWRFRPRTPAAELIRLKNLVFPLSPPADDDDAAVSRLAVSEARLTDLVLAEAGASAPGGLWGFVEAGSAAVDGLSLTMFGEARRQESLELAAKSLALKGFRGWRAAAPVASTGGWPDLLGSLKASEFALSGLRLRLASDTGTIELEIGEHRLSAFREFAFDEAVLKKGSVKATAPRRGLADFSGALAEASVSGLDLRPLVGRLQRAYESAEPGGRPRSLQAWVAALDESKTAADCFVWPFALGEAALKDGAFDFDGLKGSFEEIALSGPFEAGAIPPAQAFKMSGFQLELPAPGLGPVWDEIARAFGRRLFALNVDFRSQYAPETGTLTYAARPLLGGGDLFSLTAQASATGLTPEALGALAQIRLKDLPLVMIPPGLEDLALTELELGFENGGLVDGLFGLSASRQGMPKEAFKTLLVNGLAVAAKRLAPGGDGGQAAAQLADFLKNPQTLALEARPEPPYRLGGLFGAAPLLGLFEGLGAKTIVNGQTQGQAQGQAEEQAQGQ